MSRSPRPATPDAVREHNRHIAELVDQLAAGRDAAEDPDLALLRDDPLSVVRHVTSRRRVSVDLRRSEIEPVWAVLDWVELEVDRLRLAALEAAKAAGMSYPDLAPILRVTGRAGVEARRARLRAAVAGGRKDERPVRAAGRRRRADDRTRRDHGAELLQLARDLLEHTPPDLLEEVAIVDLRLELVEHRGAVAPSDGLLAGLRRLVADLHGLDLSPRLREVVDGGRAALG